MKPYNKSTLENNVLFGENRSFILTLYNTYLHSPADIHISMRQYFDSFSNKEKHITNPTQICAQQSAAAKECGNAITSNTCPTQILNNYRQYAHNFINFDIFTKHIDAKNSENAENASILLGHISSEHLNAKLPSDTLSPHIHDTCNTLQDLVTLLQSKYLNKIGYEISHLESDAERSWWYERVESSTHDTQISQDALKRAEKITGRATVFEEYLHQKFAGMKRFSIEGLESVIAALDHTINITNAKNIIIGMAHRGRLNALANVMNKSAQAIFHEARNLNDDKNGDVKYHMGIKTHRSNKEITLLNNPSHLESINGVAMGHARAKIDSGSSALTILIHGDASLSGQGVVMETLAMSKLPGYDINGTIHIVANNQIGFTASSQSCRSSQYCTDIAKFIAAPVLHVSAYDIAEILQAIKLANEYRNTFKKDIFIDIIGYRYHGHNEGDEPRFTHPTLYEKLYSNDFRKIVERAIDPEQYNIIREEYIKHLDSEYEKAQADNISNVSDNAIQQNISSACDKITVSLNELQKIGSEIIKLPKNFNINRKILRQFQNRTKMLSQEVPCDWATAENLAFATILKNGIAIRMSGQDVERGTFSHRHAVLFDQQTEEKYIPLNNITDAAKLSIHNSHLSEYGALSFEYGYNCASIGKTLTIWEAQFGDFINGAQIVIDQYLTSGYAKWKEQNNLILLLPHGYDGQGPEHSSARLERFLQLCTENNMSICNCTTPASFFQLLLRQTTRHTPLIIMSPKSLLRHKDATSSLHHFTKSFQPILQSQPNADSHRMIICSGKIFYDLRDMQRKKSINNVNIVRLEEIYPFPAEEISQIIKKSSITQLIICQEEPENMGHYHFTRLQIERILKKLQIHVEIIYAGRPESSSPATGFMRTHLNEQQKLLQQAFDN